MLGFVTWLPIYGYTMGTSGHGLPDIYTQSTRAAGLRVYISAEPLVLMV